MCYSGFGLPKFQPTLPVWGETSGDLEPVANEDDFNPLSPCGERPEKLHLKLCIIQFQPTLPVWGETTIAEEIRAQEAISTHSPRVGRDFSLIYFIWVAKDFNPLSPCGERLETKPILKIIDIFQPTLPVWGETTKDGEIVDLIEISTHSPRVGRDMVEKTHLTTITDFNPLSPCGERPSCCLLGVLRGGFQPTLPVWGETKLSEILGNRTIISTHSPRVGRDAQAGSQAPAEGRISTHSPRVGRDKMYHKTRVFDTSFQPTLPVWGETTCMLSLMQYIKISTHSPRVGRDGLSQVLMTGGG